MLIGQRGVEAHAEAHVFMRASHNYRMGFNCCERAIGDAKKENPVENQSVLWKYFQCMLATLVT